MCYVAHRLFAVHDRYLGALIAAALARGGETVPSVHQLQHLLDACTVMMVQLSGNVSVIPADNVFDPLGRG